MRLDKYLHDALGVSRSQAKKLVRSGRISLSSESEKDPARHVGESESVCLDGVPIDAPAMANYIMLHKPASVVCATRDRTQITVIDLIQSQGSENLKIAGRLDIDATGLVLLSDDGQWIHRITSPRHKQPKLYHVRLAEPLHQDAERQFARGIYLKNEDKRTRPAELNRLSDTEVRVTLVEGRYHQVKRMFAAVGNRVIRLHRVAIGPLELDPDLKPGSWRELSDSEVYGLQNP